MKQYLELLEKILTEGERKTNRTGIDTLSITGAQLKFDLREGFPLITTRKAPIKSALTELEFFIKGITDKKWLQDRKCKFWDEWCNPQKVPYGHDEETKQKMKDERDLGEIYSYLWNHWESDRNIVEVHEVDVKIEKAVYVPVKKAQKSSFKDSYGEEIYKDLFKVWKKMINDCYSKDNNNGIYVDLKWHSFDSFLEDVTKLPGWTAKLRYHNQYVLDKEYFGTNVYSVKTCVWASKADSDLYKTSKAFNIIDKNGNKTLYISTNQCAQDYGLSESSIKKVLDRKIASTKGFKFEYLNDGKNYRYSLPINQLRKAIETLQTNPTDRRIIVSAWNPSVFYKQGLPACHNFYNFVSDGKYLDLIFNMRSSDFPIGANANFSSYGTLLLLVATQVNMIPRYLIYSAADVHIYVNQIESIKEQLKREPKPLPKLEIIKNKEQDWTIWDWNSQTDWILTGYDPHPAIKFEVAV